MSKRILAVVVVAGLLVAGIGWVALHPPRGGSSEDVLPPGLVPPAPSTVVPFALTDGPIPGFPDLRASTQQQLQLDRLPATLTLPEVKLPPKIAEITDEFVLEPEEIPNPKGAKRELKVIRAPLPFPVETDEQTFRPDGMLVTIDGKPVPFGRGPAPAAKRSTWRINGKYIVLSHKDMPAPGSLKVRHEGVIRALERHDPAKVEGGAAAFVTYDLTLRGETRHGLLLPAPTIAQWDVVLPERNATFEGWIALEQAPLDKPRSDGATVALTVTVDGKEITVDAQELDDARPEFHQWRVDLTPWAGKRVSLRIATSPHDNPLFDWVFVGSPTVWGPPNGDVRRVVVIAMDTTRFDDLSFHGHPQPTTPEIDAWAKTGISFDRTWSTAPRTRPSFRSSTTGRLPLEAVGATNIGEVFAKNGFATAGFVANVHLQPRFDFDQGFDLWRFDGRATAEDEVNAAIGWLESNQEVDSYLFVHFMDPHMAYDAPGEFRDKFVTDPDPDLPAKVKRSEVLTWMKDGTLDERRKRQLRALHDGELAYTSSELGRLFDALDRMPGRTLVALYSDHGEEFWEHEGFEHNHSLYDELTRTVFVLRPRGGLAAGARVDTPVTLMDLAPTLYDFAGFADAPETDGRTLVPLIAGAKDWPDRPLPIGYLQYSHERWGIVWNDHKYMLHTGTGREELFDLVRDPGETRNIAESRDLAPYRSRLAAAHGLKVGPGFRLRIDLPETTDAVVVTVPTPVVDANVLDPESIVEHRANVEWGELPRRLPSDVGAVTVAEDRRTITFTPGRYPEGIVYLLFDTVVDPATVSVALGAQALLLEEAKRGRLWKDGEKQILLDPGTIVVPPPTEADLMGIGPKAAAAAGDHDMLCALGYVTEGCDEGDVEPQDEEGFVDPDAG